MVQAITEGISISVETFYQEEQSIPHLSEFSFAYRITIENNTPHPIQLLRRSWYIHDSSGPQRQVHGEGVVGQQPIIEPTQSFQYVSGCQLRSEVGKMLGFYTFENKVNGKYIEAQIPMFQLVAPQKYN